MNFDPAKYCLVLNSLTATGGVELRTLEFARFLRTQNREPVILVLRRSGQVQEIFERENFEVIELPVYVQSEKEFRIKPLGMMRLWLHLMQKRYGVILGLIPPSCYLVSLVCLPKLGRGLVIMERDATSRISRFYRFFNNQIRRIVDYRVCVSEFLRDRILQTTKTQPEQVLTIENGTELEPDKGTELPWRDQVQDHFVFGSLGRLEPVKAPDLAVKAFAELKKRMPNRPLALMIVGAGSQEEGLKRLIHELQLEECVHMTGFQAHPQDFYGLFDAFLMPSTNEGLGTAWIEAMAHSVPVIASDLRPLNDYIRHEVNGLLFETGNVAALTDAMERMVNDPKLAEKLRQNGEKTYREKFVRQTQMQKLFDVCENARKLTPPERAQNSE